MKAALALALAAALAGCGDDGGPDCEGHSHDPICMMCSGEEDPAEPGTRVDGDAGVFSIELVEASQQVRPDVNVIVIRVLDAAGDPVDGVSFDAIEPTGNTHSSPLIPVAMATGEPGEYEISSLAYLEPGTWEVRFELSAGGQSDVVTFEFCVEDLEAS